MNIIKKLLYTTKEKINTFMDKHAQPREIPEEEMLKYKKEYEEEAVRNPYKEGENK